MFNHGDGNDNDPEWPGSKESTKQQYNNASNLQEMDPGQDFPQHKASTHQQHQQQQSDARTAAFQMQHQAASLTAQQSRQQKDSSARSLALQKQ